MSLVWLYAVQADDRVPQVTGVDGEVPRLVHADRLAAVVGTVSEQDFDEAALAAAMDDLPRIERLARAHHAVIAAAAGSGAVAPLRLATVYRDDEAVARLLQERATEFASILDRVRDRREWGVKVYVGAAAEAPPDEPGPAGERPGTAYLLRRRADRDRGAQASARARQVADEVHRTLAALAAAEQQLRLQDARLSGRAQEMVLNATYLVDAAAEDRFRAALAGIGTAGAIVELTGPWPPFSFARTETP